MSKTKDETKAETETRTTTTPPTTKSKSSTGTKPKPRVNVWGGEEDEKQPNSAFNDAVEAAIAVASGNQGEPSSVPVTFPVVSGQDQKPHQQDSQIASKPEKQKPDRAGAGYTKATYRVRDGAIDAVEDMRLALKRQYGIKALREEIVEEAILAAQRDLLALGEASFLVRALKPESQ